MTRDKNTAGDQDSPGDENTAGGRYSAHEIAEGKAFAQRSGSRFSHTARWTVVFVVVMLALVVAIWPRGGDDYVGGMEQPQASGPRATDAQASDEDLAQARVEAALAPCPETGGQPGPESLLAGIEVPCLASGESYDIGAATAGKPLLINMWAHWCLPCQRELPIIEDYAGAVGDQLTVLAVHDRNGANPFLALTLLTEVGVGLPSVLDSEGKIAAALNLPPVLPQSILVRADGTIASIEPTVFDSVDELADVVDEKLGVRP